MTDPIDRSGITGTGESRSAEVTDGDGLDTSAATDEASELATIPGATSPSRQTEQGTGFANRSGSGGSGGSGDPVDEGSGGQTMDELLQGGGPSEDEPRH